MISGRKCMTVTAWKHSWEPQYLENSREYVFRNTFKDIEYIVKSMGDLGTRFEFECYDTAHLYNLNYFLEQGMVKPPLFVQTVFGLQGGTGAHPEDVLHMKRTAERLFGQQPHQHTRQHRRDNHNDRQHGEDALHSGATAALSGRPPSCAASTGRLPPSPGISDSPK